MVKKKTIYFYIGTTAELIKIAYVLKELKKRKIDFRIITSGQDYVNFKSLEPFIGKQKAYNALKLKTIRFPLNIYFRFITWSIKTFVNNFLYFKNEFNEIDKDKSLFIVLGDTVSTFLGAVSAKIYGLKLVHIESGYRSFNFFEPFPEELSRYLVSKLSDIHFCPNDWCLNNIKNIKGIKVSTGQNTVYEICMNALKMKSDNYYLNKVSKSKFFLLILHRQEHMIFKKELTKKYINLLLSKCSPNLKCVFVLHPVTETFLRSENMLEEIKKNRNIITIPKIPYSEFMKILLKSEFIATDGGGNQQEAYYLGKPCILLRKYTEQIEGLYSNAVLAKDDPNIVKDFLANYKKKITKKVTVKSLPSKIIVDTILESYK